MPKKLLSENNYEIEVFLDKSDYWKWCYRITKPGTTYNFSSHGYPSEIDAWKDAQKEIAIQRHINDEA